MYRNNLERMAQIYGGIAIFGVEPGTTSHRAGVRAGDILVAVNGRRVRRLSDYAGARQLRRETLELVVVRNGQEVTLWTGDAATSDAAVPKREDVFICRWRGAA
jgi:S1-C subfamily serine protease